MNLAHDDARPILEAMMATTEFKPTLMDRTHDEGVEEGIEKGIEKGIDRGKAEFLLKGRKARGLERLMPSGSR
jgi:hypothetical protein